VSAQPAPEVPVRPARDDEVPAGAVRLMRAAGTAGWAVEATYARGTYPRREPRVVDSLAVRLSHPAGLRAVAVWIDRKFSCGYLWGKARALRSYGARALLAQLSGCPDPLCGGDGGACPTCGTDVRAPVTP
jgi:hypothetical protein